jgi:PIN domain nuclease of toxin-antitoxin system
MRVLLDTHAWLWSVDEVSKLSQNARALLADPAHEIFVSAASVWEIAIKVAIGKFHLPAAPKYYIPATMLRQGVRELPITSQHAIQVATLPLHHKDLFDRLIVAQAQVEQIPLVTSDPLFRRYDIETIWAHDEE